jgi:hypothetical protein
MMLLSSFTRGRPSVRRNANIRNCTINKSLFVAGFTNALNSIHTKNAVEATKK